MPALLAAPHWAVSDGRAAPAVRERIGREYGSDVLDRIEAVLRMIRMGNLMGNALDYILYLASFGRWGGEVATRAEARGD